MVYKEKLCFLRKLFIIVGLLFVPLFIILNTTDTFAYNNWYDVTSVSGRRSYLIRSYNEQQGCTGGTPVWNNDTLGTLYPGDQTLLMEGNCRYFGGVSLLNISTTSGSYRSYTTVYASMTLRAHNGWPNYNGATNNSTSVVNMSVRGDDGNSYASQQCVNSAVGDDYLQKMCSVTLPRDIKPVAITGFRFGTVNDPGGGIFPVLINAQNAPVVLGYVGWGYDTSDSPEVAKLDEVISQQQATTNAVNNLNTTINNYYDQESDSIDNISEQSTSDIPNSSDSQTTSIIGTISSFVTALGTIQTGTCQLTLPFPQFLGGDTVVNPCNGKDKAPTIVTVGSSMFLIGVFIPFAFIVLKMIYNEIRSFTNG